MNIFRKFLNSEKSSIAVIESFPSIKEDIHTILSGCQKQYPEIILLWGGNIWDKAKAFVDKTQAIQDIGLKTTKKIVLWSELTQECETNNAFLSKITQSISMYYQQSPVLVVRSSGQWDATGVGIYESSFTLNDPAHIQSAIEKVLASNRTLRANEYRRIRWISSAEMWIIIEPCIGNMYYDKYIWPELSGRWKPTEDGSMDIWVALWIGGGVNDGNYYRINNNMFWWQSLADHIEETRQYGRLKHSEENEESSLYHQYFMDKIPFMSQSYISMSLYSLQNKEKSMTQISEAIKKKIYAYDPWMVFDSMKKLKRAFKQPQYIERATVINPTWPVTTYVTQIASTLQDAVAVDINQKGNCIWETKKVTHSWIKDIDKIILVDVWWSDFMSTEKKKKYMQSLMEYNRQNKNYLLMVSDKISYGWELPFESFSNAAAIIEIRSAFSHNDPPASHYEWLLSATNILFSVTEKEIADILVWDYASKSVGDYYNIKEFTENKFRLVQDAKKWIGKLFLKE